MVGEGVVEVVEIRYGLLVDGFCFGSERVGAHHRQGL